MNKRAFIYITNKCNQHCLHCYRDSKASDNDELSIEAFENLVKELKIMGFTNINIDGGEPFLRDDLLDLIDIIKSHDITPTVVSNASMHTEESLKQLRGHLTHLNFSLDSSQSTPHDTLRQINGSFDRTILSIRTALSLNFNVKVWSTITRLNIANDAEHIPALLDSLGPNDVNLFVFYVFSEIGRGFKNKNALAPSQEEWQHFLSKAETLSKQYPWVMYEPGIIPRDTQNSYPYYSGCNAHTRSRCFIDANGDVSFCSLLFRTKHILGNIHRQSFAEIWNHSPVWESPFYQYNTVSVPCHTCQDELFCKGGCVAHSVSQGTMYGNDTRCTPSQIPLCSHYFHSD